jgi:hypothetical protein
MRGDKMFWLYHCIDIVGCKVCGEEEVVYDSAQFCVNHELVRMFIKKHRHGAELAMSDMRWVLPPGTTLIGDSDGTSSHQA